MFVKFKVDMLIFVRGKKTDVPNLLNKKFPPVLRTDLECL